MDSPVRTTHVGGSLPDGESVEVHQLYRAPIVFRNLLECRLHCSDRLVSRNGLTRRLDRPGQRVEQLYSRILVATDIRIAGMPPAAALHRSMAPHHASQAIQGNCGRPPVERIRSARLKRGEILKHLHVCFLEDIFRLDNTPEVGRRTASKVIPESSVRFGQQELDRRMVTTRGLVDESIFPGELFHWITKLRPRPSACRPKECLR